MRKRLICIAAIVVFLAGCSYSDPAETASLTTCDYCFVQIPESEAFLKYDGPAERGAGIAAQKALYHAMMDAYENGEELNKREQNDIFEAAYNEGLKNTMCQDCVYAEYRSLLNGNAQTIIVNESVESNDGSKNNEYLFDEDYIFYERSECNWCGNAAPSDLRMDNGEAVCVDCISEALQDSKVAKAIWKYIEG